MGQVTSASRLNVQFFANGGVIRCRTRGWRILTAFSRFASATTLALAILGYFVLDRSLQQLPRSFAQELFQIACRFDFCSLLERGHINVHSECIISFRLLG
jgi:hypothetical protein